MCGMDSPRRDPPLHPETSRSLWIGWGFEVLLMLVAFLIGGAFIPCLCACLAVVMILRGLKPAMFARHFDAGIISGTPYRREESLKRWAASLLLCVAVA